MLQVCLHQSWPQDKPIAKIVFPKILPSSLGNLPTLWLMLPKQETQHHLYSKLYRHFLFMELPYPMLLWMSAFHTQEQEDDFRWFPYYLDLKDPNHQEITRSLAETGYYRLLLFSCEEPQRCAQVMTVSLTPHQCRMLREAVNTSRLLQPTARPSVSRDLLKTEFDKLKSQSSIAIVGNKLTA